MCGVYFVYFNMTALTFASNKDYKEIIDILSKYTKPTG